MAAALGAAAFPGHFSDHQRPRCDENCRFLIFAFSTSKQAAVFAFSAAIITGDSSPVFNSEHRDRGAQEEDITMFDEEAQARVDVWKYAYGFDAMRVVKCAIELGSPDVLESHGSPMKLSELSSAVAGPPGQQIGISAADLKAGKGSGGGSAPTEDVISNMEVDQSYNKLFQDFLACHAKAATCAVISNCLENFKGIGSLVDVGGQEGTAIGMLVNAFPWIRGINFDLPQVISGATPLDGVEHVGGDMFESVPKADAVMLMWILHDWSDELCVNILKNCKEAIPKDTGKVIIVEAVIDEEGGDEYTGARLALDMTIMASTVHGKERTDKEWAQLLNAAGFSSHTIKHMEAIESLIEAYP
ncbi:hypothetical protein BUALT_Bualt14G0004200 [Buddleja alternifolia]|uniref:O-methyltransferase C-terminal domain-containing protein n=1 Tax=Buddleja alternifolia TaxID=168488 RepID=A0AAV6WQT0_9LAMI|nr:hypothetical protein BUALT_Bualt14G0004200 [Buddleja alternifolia]